MPLRSPPSHATGCPCAVLGRAFTRVDTGRSRWCSPHSTAPPLGLCWPEPLRRRHTPWPPPLPWPPPRRTPCSASPLTAPTTRPTSPPLSEAHKPGRPLPGSPERRRQRKPPPPAPARRGQAASGRPQADSTHHNVALDLPELFPSFPLVGGDRRRRNRPAPPSQRRLLCFGRPGTRLLDCKSSRDPSAISSFVFNCCCELLNSIKNHRKIRKMQTKFC